MRWLICVLALGACKGAVEKTCDDLCRELVQGCDYDAFPSLDSCRQGCAYDAGQGGDVEAQLECVTDAACDTFAIVECQHAYGADAE